MTRRAVFLDRDGVITRPIDRDGISTPPLSFAELEILPGVERACGELRAAGFLLVIVTNQPDVSRGAVERSEVDALNAAVLAAVPVDDLRACFHDDADDCACRKPRPGLITDAAREWSIDLAESYMVGDRWRDVEAGRAAGCRTVFVEHELSEPKRSEPWATAANLTEAAAIILGASVRETR